MSSIYAINRFSGILKNAFKKTLQLTAFAFNYLYACLVIYFVLHIYMACFFDLLIFFFIVFSSRLKVFQKVFVPFYVCR